MKLEEEEHIPNMDLLLKNFGIDLRQHISANNPQKYRFIIVDERCKNINVHFNDILLFIKLQLNKIQKGYLKHNKPEVDKEKEHEYNNYEIYNKQLEDYMKDLIKAKEFINTNVLDVESRENYNVHINSCLKDENTISIINSLIEMINKIESVYKFSGKGEANMDIDRIIENIKDVYETTMNDFEKIVGGKRRSKSTRKRSTRKRSTRKRKSIKKRNKRTTRRRH